jgi:homoprotocatechuate degradation regulator HpaR
LLNKTGAFVNILAWLIGPENRRGIEMAETTPPLPLRRTGRSLPIALLRGRETVMAPIRDMLAKSPVNEQKWRVLRVLIEDGPMEISAVADRACLQMPSLTRIVQAMEAEGFVARAADATDRRKSIITATSQGRAVITAHAAESQAFFARLEALYGKEKLEQLLDLLEELRAINL